MLRPAGASDEERQKEAHHRQSAKLPRHSSAAKANISDRLKCESAQAIAIKQFALDQDQRSRLLIRESHQEKLTGRCPLLRVQGRPA
jgi:hypothetical protein